MSGKKKIFMFSLIVLFILIQACGIKDSINGQVEESQLPGFSEEREKAPKAGQSDLTVLNEMNASADDLPSVKHADNSEITPDKESDRLITPQIEITNSKDIKTGESESIQVEEETEVSDISKNSENDETSSIEIVVKSDNAITDLEKNEIISALTKEIDAYIELLKALDSIQETDLIDD